MERQREFDPLSPNALHDPYAEYERLRMGGGLYWFERISSWVTVRLDTTRQILLDSDTFSSDPRRVGGIVSADQDNLQLQDPPESQQLRRTLLECYRQHDWTRLRSRVRGELLQSLRRLAAMCEGDLLETVMEPVVFSAISDLVGLSTLSLPDLKRHSAAIVDAMDSGLRPEVAALGTQARDQLNVAIQRELAHPPKGSLIFRLRGGCSGADGISPCIVNSVRAILHAGFAPSVKAVGNGVVALLASPEHYARVAETGNLPWDLELLRVSTPVHAVARMATRSVNLENTPVAEGDVLVALLAAANRDPEHFYRPGDLDPSRPSGPAIPFGVGPHFCLGSSLARLLMQIAIPAIAQRFPGLVLAGPPEPLPNAVLRGYRLITVKA